MPELPLGSVVGGVRIDAVTGRGGMGVVYRGTQLALKRTVALKVVRDDLASSAEFRRRFTQESEIAASLDHPHIVPIHSAGEDAGQLHVVMRFVDGTDLREAIRASGRLDPGLAAEIVRQIASALDAAHRRGLMHRDVKPANILLSTADDGRPHAYLTDFGLSRFADSEQLTATGTVVGTLDYMAPEQLEGRRIDGRVDVYALGCVLYQALTGRVPYPRDSEQAKMWAHMTEPPPRPGAVAPDLPPGFDEVIARALAKRPEERYATAGELGAAAVAAAQGAGGFAGRTVDIPRQASAPATEVAPSWPAAAHAGAPPTAAPGGPAPAYPTRPFPPSGDGGASGPAPWPPDSAPRQQWDHRGGQQPPPWGPQPFLGSGSGGYGSPSYPSGPVPAPRSGTKMVVILLVVLFVVSGVAGVAVLAVRASDGGSGGTTTTAPAVPGRPAGALVGAPIAVGKEPHDIEAGEGFVWTANSDGTISKVDPAKGTAEQITVGGVPAELTVAQGGVWVWNYSDAVTRVDVASGEVSDPISANGTGNITGTAVGGGFLWLSHSSSNSVSRIDLTTRLATGTPTTVGAAPINLAFGNRLLYVSNSGEQTISVLDGSTGAVTGDPIKLDEKPAGIAVNDGTIYVGTTDDVTPVDEGSFVVGEPIALKGGSYFLADSGGIWVTFPLVDELHWLDLKGQETRGGPIAGVGKGVGDLVLLDDGVWISNTTDGTVEHVRVTR